LRRPSGLHAPTEKNLTGATHKNAAWRWAMPGYWQKDPFTSPPTRLGHVLRRWLSTDTMVLVDPPYPFSIIQFQTQTILQTM
jgi:hypothetical protein